VDDVKVKYDITSFKEFRNYGFLIRGHKLGLAIWFNKWCFDIWIEKKGE